MFRRLLSRRPTVQPPDAHPEPIALSTLAGEAARIVVVDTETTGVYTADRIVEVAAVTMNLTGEIIDEWETLVDPQRDVGPTWLHGISASMLLGAPTFEEVAGSLAVRLHGAALVAHNLPFDARMLSHEYARIGVEVDLSGGLDTLRVTRCKLAVACQRHGIPLDGPHRALNDARATARLLLHVAPSLTACGPPATFLKPVARDARRCHSRDGCSPAVSAGPGRLAGLAVGLDHAEAETETLNYLDVLDRAMADLHLDGAEREGLDALATDLGLNEGQLVRANRRWLDDLIASACADGRVDAREYDQLCRAAAVLGVQQEHVDRRTERQRTSGVAVPLAGSVCFTGEAIDAFGEAIPRSRLKAHAQHLGLSPVPSVTKSGCNLLVAADPASSSGKAAKARRHGIPIVSATDFLAATPGQVLTGAATAVGIVDTLTCLACGRAWTRPKSGARRKPANCPTCAPPEATDSDETVSRLARSAKATTGVAGDSGSPSSEGAVIESLRCLTCGATFERQRARGRKPKACPSCR